MFETEAWRVGEEGREEIARWFRRHGCHTISLDRIDEDGAPSLIGDHARDRVVLTDLLVTQHGIARAVEVKTKATATFHLNTRTWEHGVAARLFDHYQRLVRELGIEVWLAIYQLDIGMVLTEDVCHLQRVRRDYTGDRMGELMVFFPCREFQQYHGPSAPLVKPIPPTAVRTLQQEPAPPCGGPKQGDLFR